MTLNKIQPPFSISNLQRNTRPEHNYFCSQIRCPLIFPMMHLGKMFTSYSGKYGIRGNTLKEYYFERELKKIKGGTNST
jgi:hypothetical protein